MKDPERKARRGIAFFGYGVGDILAPVGKVILARNAERFPDKFMFQLNKKEKDGLVTNWRRFGSLKHSTSLPYAFTEYGVAMLASVLKGDRAVKISIHIVEIFIQLREFISTHKELAHKLQDLEKKIGRHDKEITAIIEVIKGLMMQPEKSKGKIGFH